MVTPGVRKAHGQEVIDRGYHRSLAALLLGQSHADIHGAKIFRVGENHQGIDIHFGELG